MHTFSNIIFCVYFGLYICWQSQAIILDFFFHLTLTFEKEITPSQVWMSETKFSWCLPRRMTWSGKNFCSSRISPRVTFPPCLCPELCAWLSVIWSPSARYAPQLGFSFLFTWLTWLMVTGPWYWVGLTWAQISWLLATFITLISWHILLKENH